jgi:hypothetical protein
MDQIINYYNSSGIELSIPASSRAFILQCETELKMEQTMNESELKMDQTINETELKTDQTMN